MKTQMDRVYPILVDIGTQLEKDNTRDYVFFYDDGQVYRAFCCDSVVVEEKTVRAISGNHAIVTLPASTSWRLVRKDGLEFVTGKELDEADLRNLKAKKDFQKQLTKELGLDKKDEDETTHEYKEGFNPKLYR